MFAMRYNEPLSCVVVNLPSLTLAEAELLRKDRRSKALDHTSSYSFDPNTSAASLYHTQASMASRVKPSKQAIHALMVSLFELLKDLVLSFMGYCALVIALCWLIADIVWAFYSPGWNFHQRNDFMGWRWRIMFWTVLSLWAARFVLRWRKHLACTWGYLACILRWLSPLSPKPYETCPCCQIGTHEELASDQDEQDDECAEQRGIGIFL